MRRALRGNIGVTGADFCGEGGRIVSMKRASGLFSGGSVRLRGPALAVKKNDFIGLFGLTFPPDWVRLVLCVRKVVRVDVVFPPVFFRGKEAVV